jgi:hypothetical protein
MINRRGCTVVSLGATILTLLMGVPAVAATLQPNRLDVEYVPPKSSAHDLMYKLVRERRVLEKIRDLLVQLSERKGLISLQPPIQGTLRRVPRDNGVKTFTRLY